MKSLRGKINNITNRQVICFVRIIFAIAVVCFIVSSFMMVGDDDPVSKSTSQAVANIFISVSGALIPLFFTDRWKERIKTPGCTIVVGILLIVAAAAYMLLSIQALSNIIEQFISAKYISHIFTLVVSVILGHLIIQADAAMEQIKRSPTPDGQNDSEEA